MTRCQVRNSIKNKRTPGRQTAVARALHHTYYSTPNTNSIHELSTKTARTGLTGDFAENASRTHELQSSKERGGPQSDNHENMHKHRYFKGGGHSGNFTAHAHAN